ncbi:MAG TPA: agmatine deiminase family protein [Trueperaceae bacterium]
MQTEKPVALGFSMPAEWERHAATWTCWPFGDELWEGYLEGVREDFAGLVATISRFEPVWLNVCDDETRQDAGRRLTAAGARMDAIRFHHMALNDVWFRDNGPLFIRSEGKVALTDWVFNAWGRKYSPWDADNRAPQKVADVLGMKRFAVPYVMEGGALEWNSRRVCLTTRSCLLSPMRNPELDQDDIEGLLHDYLGAKHVVWLEGGMQDDHTDGHIDTIARFTDDRTIVCVVREDDNEPDYDTLQDNLTLLQTLRDQDGQPYQVVPLPLPEKRLELNGKRLPLTYANFYIGNGFVVVPTYDDVNDDRALAVLGELFPEREVIGLPAGHLITGGGAFHCVTQQQPAGEVYGG